MSEETPYEVTGKVNYEWIGESFEIYKRDVGVWIAATLIIGLASLIIQYVCGAPTVFTIIHVVQSGQGLAGMPKPSLGTQWSSNILLGIVASFFYTGQFAMSNKAVRGEKLSLSDLFTHGGLYFPFLIYYIIYSISAFLGVIACCIGVFFLPMLVWPGFAVLSDEGDVQIALSKSVEHMKRDWLNAGGLFFVYSLVTLASFIPCGLGLFVTGPMLYIIASLAYRDMIGMPGVSQPASGLNQSEGSWPPPPNSV